MVIPVPGVYEGTIRHRRFEPRQHESCYSLFMALVNIDRVESLMGVSCLTSCNTWNIAWFDERDHLGEPGRPLRQRVHDSAAAAGKQLPAGPIYLLTHLRYAGYVFSPISVYYCFDTDGRLANVLADVRNTYGGRRQYWLEPLDSARHRFHSRTKKTMHVSPFMDMAVDYEFVLTPPEERLVGHMNVCRQDDGDRMFDATLSLERRPWTAASIRRAVIRYPLMTAKVIGAIHWEALRLRLKRLPVVPAAGGRQ